MSLLKNRQHLKYNSFPINYCLIKTDSLRKDCGAGVNELLCFDAIEASFVNKIKIFQEIIPWVFMFTETNTKEKFVLNHLYCRILSFREVECLRELGGKVLKIN